VNGAALNYHWRSKQHLWEAVCERVGLWFGTIAAQINLSAPPRDAIAGFLRLVFDGLVRDPHPIRVVGWAALLPHDADREGVAHHFKPFVGFAYAYIRAQQALGAIPATVDTDVLVLLIYNMLTYTMLNMRGMRSAIGADLTDPALAARFREAIVKVALDTLKLSADPPAAGA
jgi:AcrR family transcriptional regulator